MSIVTAFTRQGASSPSAFSKNSVSRIPTLSQIPIENPTPNPEAPKKSRKYRLAGELRDLLQ
jgi:hypothetical protein